MDYENLLERAIKNIPESKKESSRFTIPRVKGHVQGNRTIISNFVQICDTLRRDHPTVLKFILKELASPGDLKNSLLIIGSKVSADRVNEKIKKFVEMYVLCKECGKPDTQITKQHRISFLKCSACGAKYPVVSIK